MKVWKMYDRLEDVREFGRFMTVWRKIYDSLEDVLN